MAGKGLKLLGIAIIEAMKVRLFSLKNLRTGTGSAVTNTEEGRTSAIWIRLH